MGKKIIYQCFLRTALEKDKFLNKWQFIEESNNNLVQYKTTQYKRVVIDLVQIHQFFTRRINFRFVLEDFQKDRKTSNNEVTVNSVT